MFGSHLAAPYAMTAIQTARPTPVQIMRLWQVFLKNVDPLVKLFHAPTTQQMVFDAAANADAVSTSNQALMFSIYLLSVISMTEEECVDLLGQGQAVSVTTFSRAAAESLEKANYMTSNTVITLQALVLYLVSLVR